MADIDIVRGDTYIENLTIVNPLVQVVTIHGAPTGGVFQLGYDGHTTQDITHNATAPDVEAALEALANLAPADVSVSGGAGPATPWTVTFGGAVTAGTVTLLTITTTGLTGGFDIEGEVTNGGFDLTGCVLFFTLKDNLAAADPGVLQHKSDDVSPQLAITDAVNGVATHELTAAETALLDPSKTYTWDYQLKDATGRIKTLVIGTLAVTEDVTDSTS